jgi:hypothetical protein
MATRMKLHDDDVAILDLQPTRIVVVIVTQEDVGSEDDFGFSKGVTYISA